jgi:hypothetical protein
VHDRRLPRRRHHPRDDHPARYGERLDLDYAIYVCFANARIEQERRAPRHDAEPEVRDRVTIYEAEDWDDRIRRYYDEHAGDSYRVTEPIYV